MLCSVAEHYIRSFTVYQANSWIFRRFSQIICREKGEQAGEPQNVELRNIECRRVQAGLRRAFYLMGLFFGVVGVEWLGEVLVFQRGDGMGTDAIAVYLEQINRAVAKGDATERTHRPALKTLIEALGEKITATNV